MAVNEKNDAHNSGRVTQSKQNAMGRPIIPVLIAVAIVAIFIGIYRIGTGANNHRDATAPQARVASTYQVPYTVHSSASTATGRDQIGTPLPSATTTGAVGSSTAAEPSSMGTAGSSSLPMDSSAAHSDPAGQITPDRLPSPSNAASQPAMGSSPSSN